MITTTTTSGTTTTTTFHFEMLPMQAQLEAIKLAPTELTDHKNPPNLLTNPPNPLDLAINAGRQRLLEGNEQMLTTIIELACKMGQNIQILSDEKARFQESKEKSHRDWIRAVSITAERFNFERSLVYANVMKGAMERYVVNAHAGQLKYERKHPYMKRLSFTFMKPKYAGIDEANRLKGMICVAILEIEKAIEWLNREIDPI